MDKLQKLNVFVRVAELSSFSAAAHESGHDQSTISRSIASLEDEWGVRLLHRSTRSVTLTSAGHAAYVKARALLGDYRELDSTMTGNEFEQEGPLKINASYALAHFLLAPHIPKYLAGHPNVELEIVSSDHLLDLVAGAIDLAFVAGPLQDSSHMTKKIGQFELIPVASLDFVTEYGQPTEPRQLEQFPCLVTSLGQRAAHWVLTSSDVKAEVEVAGPLLANAGGIIREGILLGLGIGLVPSFLAHDDLRAGKLLRLLPEWSGPLVDLHAVWPSLNFLPEKARTFMSLISSEMSKLSDTPSVTPSRAPQSGINI